MKNTIFFAVCQYVPSLLRGESLNIGFVYHIPTHERLGFFGSNNFKRIRNFDDELDTEMINLIFESLEFDFNDSPDIYLNDDLDLDLKDSNLLKIKLYNYVNQIQFGEISVMEFEEEIDVALDDIADMMLYYDKPKAQRMSHDRVKSLARKIVKASEYGSSISSVTNDDKFYSQPYDFKLWLDDKPIYIKGFSFDYQQTNRFFKEIKVFLFDLEYAQENYDLNLSDIKVVINNTNLEAEHERKIQTILPDELEYLTLEKFSTFINEHQTNKELVHN